MAGVTYRQLDYWAREGLITPSVYEASGSGNARRWSEDDVLPIKIIDALLTCNIPQDIVRRALILLDQGEVIIARWDDVIVCNWEEARKILKKGKGWVVLDVKGADATTMTARKRSGRPRV